MLSGYLYKVKKEEENVISYFGIMVQGSLIDSEYMGISSIELMHYSLRMAVTWAT
jgi:5'-nucleotidase